MAKYVAVDKIIENVKQRGYGISVHHEIPFYLREPVNNILAEAIAKKLGINYSNNRFHIYVSEKDEESKMRETLEKLDAAYCLFELLYKTESIKIVKNDFEKKLKEIAKSLEEIVKTSG